MSVSCPECDSPLPIPDDAIPGEIIECKDCGSTYELVRDESSKLFTIREAEIEGEDWGE